MIALGGWRARRGPLLWREGVSSKKQKNALTVSALFPCLRWAPHHHSSLMFRNTFHQTGYLSILNAVGSKPLQLWSTQGAGG